MLRQLRVDRLLRPVDDRQKNAPTNGRNVTSERMRPARHRSYLTDSMK